MRQEWTKKFVSLVGRGDTAWEQDRERKERREGEGGWRNGKEDREDAEAKGFGDEDQMETGKKRRRKNREREQARGTSKRHKHDGHDGGCHSGGLRRTLLDGCWRTVAGGLLGGC